MPNRKVKRIGTTNGHQLGNIYNSDGLSPALCSTDYKAPLKILTGRKKMNKQLKENFTEVGEGKYVTTERGRESCYAVTTRPRSRPLTKKQDNYVLEMDKKKIKLRESTKKGYAEAGEGDGIEISRSGCTTQRGVVHKDATGTLNCDGASWGTLGEDFRIRRLTPRECERLQAFYPVTKEIEIWLSEQVRKNVQSVVERWHKNQKLVGNAEKDKLLKNVLSAEKSSKQKNQPIKKLVPQNVLINYVEKQIQLCSQEKSKSNVKTVEKKNWYHQRIQSDSFVHLIVGMSIILERIIHNGREELLRNGQWQIHQENGKIVLKLFGKEMMPLVNSVEEDLTIMNELTKFITSDLSSIKIQDMMLITLYCFVIGVIIGCIPIKTDLSYLEKINCNITYDWTAYGKDGEKISDTQRYKCLGNAVTTTVVTYLIEEMFKGIFEDETEKSD